MKPKGILCKAEMVRATKRLVDPKRQTRRLDGLKEINKAPGEWSHFVKNGDSFQFLHSSKNPITVKPAYPPGQILYVKETFAPHNDDVMAERDTSGIYYRADDEEKHETDGPWKPSIFMPKWAARIWLRVIDVRVERLQDISEADAIAEGVAPLFTHSEIHEPRYRAELDLKPMPFRNYLWHGDSPRAKAIKWTHQYSSYNDAKGSYASLWESINGPGSWDANPFVWVYQFERIEKPEDV